MNLLLLLATLVTTGIVSVTSVQFEIKNTIPGPIWVGILGNHNKPQLENGGFVLNQYNTKTINAPSDWAGRFWARTWCNPNTNKCETGDCGSGVQCNGKGGKPPVTLVEITLKGDQGNDFYDVSLVDGYNVKAQIQPIGGVGNCTHVKCVNDINNKCPADLQIKAQSRPSEIIACYSACMKYDTDQYCCRGAYNRRETCKTNEWKVNTAKIFKEACPTSYSYAYDDPTSTFTCKANKYIITFGG